MQVSSATDIYYNPSDTIRQPVKSLDKNAFLQLFIEQLKNQDPTAPQDTSSLISLMTQFSILEQLANICSDIEQMKLSQQMGKAAELLGKQVKVQTAESEITGQVEKVTFAAEDIKVFINGTGYSLAQVTEINQGGKE